MRQWLTRLASIGVFVGSLQEVAQAQTVTEIKLDGLTTVLQPLSDSSYIINFWATWCKPCIEEIPHFETQSQLPQNHNIQFKYISVDLPDAYPDDILAFVKKLGLQSPVYWLNESNANKFVGLVDKSWKGGIPCTLFINPKTKYHKFLEGKIPPEKLAQEITLMQTSQANTIPSKSSQE
ncbi:thiol-disulfide isomerase/thioredoxin [Chitinophaga skermanii]|uniref:Thiol-disulfide isomerase/thioredoxin n=1 Tax=Chitinophaga skermanii TaxID=331697 RepID=A0A327QGN3_9BACT|nr:TlpA disulfide reductase family protein [Chitinophaga skermanii]RAJ02493.1 thiol-disulfide isomerase/thioredoxin [Chitinophaga skermanii]